MGVPKYYRWLSERYPLVNQTIYDSIRPEFDCMYLDMNGIIHVATHGPSVDPTKPLPDDAAMACIFQYIDLVVRLGRPNHLLYMCLDGVAPRAKMNQQRQRRFRSAEARANARQVAIAKGELSPDVELFDSNCITPGTTFMEKLTNHLKFFIRKKIEEDPLWRQFTVVFSGHEVPGEAEHKIMQYIRTMKVTKGYDPNTRHLLYGLDADLIFLSLATHEPHFALLREEIVYGNPRKVDGRKPAMQTEEFQLLHISILRDCLEHEFRAIDIPFGFDLERIIDDWIFLSFFIGNDFIPNLPSMDIHHGNLNHLIALYKSLLPKFDGYVTDSGRIDMERLETLFHRLSEVELEALEMQKKDAEYLQTKKSQSRSKNVERLPIGLEPSVEAETDQLDGAPDGDEELESDVEDINSSVRDLEIEEEDLKATYYNGKWFGLMNDPQELDNLCRSYVEGLCWVLLYYFQGVPSWGWFYPYYNAPLVSSLRQIAKYQVNFTLGKPFKPFEQLLAVLPPDSAPLIPKSIANLMTDPTSPILDFYPTSFAIDMNGKTNDWEAIALIPFVDENRLIAASRSLPKSSFTKTERLRNRHGADMTFRYDPQVTEPAISLIPEMFQSLDVSHCRVEKFVLPSTGGAPFRSQLCDGVRMPAPSFPSLNLLPIWMALATVNVNVFGHPSKKESLVATIVWDPSISLLDYARGLIGKPCIVDWPFLRDGTVVTVTDGKRLFSATAPEGERLRFKHLPDDMIEERIKILTTTATDIGDCQVRVNVRLFTGMARSSSGATHKQFATETVAYPAQLVAASRSVADQRFDTAPAQSIKNAFPINCSIIYIGTPAEYYGCPGIVMSHDSAVSATIRLSTIKAELNVKACCREVNKKEVWIPSFSAATKLGLSPSLLGRISSAVLVHPGRVNLGLNLKLVQRQMMVPGYTRVKPGTSIWEYSQAALRLIKAYHVEFPELFAAIDDNAERFLELRDYVADPNGYVLKAQAWLKAQPCFRLPLVPQSSLVLSPDAIAEIERTQSAVLRKQQKREDVILPGISIQLLYKQSQRVQWSPTETQFLNLGDRVLFLGGHHGVPFGMRGNVVGTHEGEIDVVFDETILSGTDLNGRCSASRGLTLSSKCVLNLSRPRVPPLHPKVPRPGPTSRSVSAFESFSTAKPVSSAKPVSVSQSSEPQLIPNPVPSRFIREQPVSASVQATAAADESREWAIIWAGLQKSSAQQQQPKPSFSVPPPRQWANRQDQQPAPSSHGYVRYQGNSGVARAPVINHQTQRTRFRSSNRSNERPIQGHVHRQDRNSAPSSASDHPFATHSSMKTLFGLKDSPTTIARRSLIDSDISPRNQPSSSGPDRAAARPWSSNTADRSAPSDVRAFPKSSLQSSTPASRWQKRQPPAVSPTQSTIDVNFRPFGSYRQLKHKLPHPLSHTLVRPADLERSMQIDN